MATTTYTTDDLNRLTRRVVDTTDPTGESEGTLVTVTYTHDVNGNRTAELHSDGTKRQHLAWDTLNRLIQVESEDDLGQRTPVFLAGYDARTRRRVTVEASAAALATDPAATPEETQFRYDGGDAVVEHRAGAEQVYFLRGSSMGGGIGGVLYADRRAASGPIEQFVYNPAVGHTVVTLHRDGTTISANRYEAWGQVTAQSGDRTNNRLANTKERSAAIGLDNHGFRYYDPAVGRYVSRDPIGYRAGPNVYSYVRNNPINFFDPLGLCESCGSNDQSNEHKAQVILNHIREAKRLRTSPGVTEAEVKRHFEQRPGIERLYQELTGTSLQTAKLDIDAIANDQYRVKSIRAGGEQSPAVALAVITAMLTRGAVVAGGGGGGEGEGAEPTQPTEGTGSAEDGATGEQPGPEGSTGGGSQEVKQRAAPGGDGATSTITVGRDADGNVTSTTHTVERDGEIVHQHEDHVGKDGSTRRFPDSWSGTTTVDAPTPVDRSPNYPPEGNRGEKER